MFAHISQLIRVSFSLALLPMLFLGASFGCEPDTRTAQNTDLLWDQLLERFLVGTQDDQVFVKAVLAAEQKGPLADLCRVLLEEWDRPRNDQVFEVPRLIFVPTPDLLAPGTPTPTRALVLELRVSASGRVKGVQVLKEIFATPDFEVIAKKSMSQALFRPAIVDGRFAESIVTRMFRVDAQ